MTAMFTFGSLPPREALVAALIGSILVAAFLASISSVILWILRARWFSSDQGWKRAAARAWGWAMVGALICTLFIFWDPPGFERSTSLAVALISPVAMQFIVLARAPWRDG